jgi:hypothetical protein
LFAWRKSRGASTTYALASRLSFFLWNSAPDDELQAVAARGQLHRPDVLRAQTERLLSDSKSRQFVDAFLDYWLDLRKMLATAPDANLYGDYYLDDLLTESAQAEDAAVLCRIAAERSAHAELVASDFCDAE